jgi:probable rRNA maturation factor
MVRRILIDLGLCDVELGILFVDDPAIQELNRRFLRRNRPTNVIAFPMQEGEFSVLNPQLIGDVVISVDTASRQSELFGLTPEKTLILLLIHGILHLVGFDHERSKKEARDMRTKEKELLELATRRGRTSSLSHEVPQKKARNRLGQRT